MFWTKKVVIGDGERGLVYRNRRFQQILLPGVHRLSVFGGVPQVSVHNVANGAAYAGNDQDSLLEALGTQLGPHFVLANVGAQQVGLLLRNGRIDEVLPPGSRRLYWQGAVATEVQLLPLEDEPRVPTAVLHRLGQLGVLPRVATLSTVPSESVGLLFIDGTLRRALGAGLHAFWNFNGNVSVERVELRARSLDVAGQELLSRDKVTLRVNLAATVQVVDPVLAHRTLSQADEFVYRQLQFGLRQAIATRSLDELLADKAALDGEIASHVRAAIDGHGVQLLGVGIKDVILPGEMKEILNGVVLAEKQAQASVIRRREEANATRSQLNTAKLIEDNPVLMRLKELEALEKVTEKIDKLTVFGGLDGVLKQLVTMK
ncbi:slipin family protein [Stenotrophomonas sp. 24(2023)]|uniref:slipin family protein n=1 Tax=Stenotrophomonas sp. 24(2023) TaxID=3068324 RepID=UPI0027E10900|nr:slipin family protein [Stenotrophomonas sp. 24(2023)]WMJ70956.1 slipin family protein [Stenotrophomonas sp. 24(2023)]